MIQGQDFLYFFHNDAYTFYAADTSGNYYETTTPTPLNFSPVGWDGISIQWQRNTAYWGNDRTFTVPLDFIEDGATILKKIVYDTGTEAKLVMTVLKQHLEIDTVANTYGFIYRPLYRGQPDWSTFVHEGAKATVSFIDGGLASLIAANKDTVYEIETDTNYAKVLVQHTGLNIQCTATFGTLDLGKKGNITGHDEVVTMPIFNSAQEGTSVGILFGNSDFKDLVGFDLANNEDRWILKSVDQNTTITLTGTLAFTFDDFSHGGHNTWMYFQKQDGTIYDVFPNTSRVSGTYTTNINIAIPVIPGDKLFMFFSIGAGSGAEFSATQFTVTFFATYKTTVVPYVPSYWLFKQLVEKVTGGLYSADSGLLYNNSNYAFTSGDTLRGLPNAPMKTSLSDFFKWADAEFCAGMGIIDGVLRLEERGFWLTGPVTDLGEVSDLKVTPSADLFFNTIQIGYPNQTYDNVNGKDEFNNTSQYTTPRTLAKVYTQISPYRFDMYGIEFTRINLEGKTTTDSTSDNSVFGVVTLGDVGIRNLDRRLNAGTTGIIDPPSAFNIAASPEKMLERHAWYIHSIMDKLDGGLIAFQTGDKNTNMVVNGVPESSSFNIGTLAPKKFLPWYLEFTVQTPDDYEDLLAGNSLRKYSFTYKGVTGLGIAMKSGVSPADNKVQVFQLLADVSVNMSNFTSIYE